MRELWRRLKADGKTIFINSHLLQEIELVCDRVAILVRGLVQRVGRIDEITAQTEIDVTWTLTGDESAIRSVLAVDSATPLVVTDGELVQVSLTLADQAAVDRAVDALRARGVSIVSMSRPRRTLEEAFLETVRQGNGAPDGGQANSAPAVMTAGGVRR
jgi:ABC-2 type transport system ATP-binding protein